MLIQGLIGDILMCCCAVDIRRISLIEPECGLEEEVPQCTDGLHIQQQNEIGKSAGPSWLAQTLRVAHPSIKAPR